MAENPVIARIEALPSLGMYLEELKTRHAAHSLHRRFTGPDRFIKRRQRADIPVIGHET
jgi:hypothetical protein